MIGYIYALYNIETLEVLYVGSSISPKIRLRTHKSDTKKGGSRLYQFLLESGIEFDLEIKEQIEFSSKSELLKREAFWIKNYRSEGVDLKNTILYATLSGQPIDPNNRPVPIRLGDLKPVLQQQAFELGISLHRHILNILRLAIESEYTTKQAS